MNFSRLFFLSDLRFHNLIKKRSFIYVYLSVLYVINIIFGDQIYFFTNYLMVGGRISTDVSELTIFCRNFPPGQHVRQTSSAYSSGRRFRNLRPAPAISH